MTEWISVRRQSRGVLITVTQRIGNNTVSAKEVVLGASEKTIKAAVEAARKQAEMYMAGIEAAA